MMLRALEIFCVQTLDEAEARALVDALPEGRPWYLRLFERARRYALARSLLLYRHELRQLMFTCRALVQPTRAARARVNMTVLFGDPHGVGASCVPDQDEEFDFLMDATEEEALAYYAEENRRRQLPEGNNDVHEERGEDEPLSDDPNLED